MSRQWTTQWKLLCWTSLRRKCRYVTLNCKIKLFRSGFSVTKYFSSTWVATPASTGARAISDHHKTFKKLNANVGTAKLSWHIVEIFYTPLDPRLIGRLLASIKVELSIKVVYCIYGSLVTKFPNQLISLICIVGYD